VSGSQFGMTDWFGVLFINVFQSWHGSFGIDTAYGNIITEDQSAAPVQFVPTASPGAAKSQTTSVHVYTAYSSGGSMQNNTSSAVLASTTAQPISQKSTRTLQVVAQQEPYDFRLLIVVGSLFMVGLSGIAIKRLLQQ